MGSHFCGAKLLCHAPPLALLPKLRVAKLPQPPHACGVRGVNNLRVPSLPKSESLHPSWHPCWHSPSDRNSRLYSRKPTVCRMTPSSFRNVRGPVFQKATQQVQRQPTRLGKAGCGVTGNLEHVPAGRTTSGAKAGTAEQTLAEVEPSATARGNETTPCASSGNSHRDSLVVVLK
jgi:hypothetical protein